MQNSSKSHNAALHITKDIAIPMKMFQQLLGNSAGQWIAERENTHLVNFPCQIVVNLQDIDAFPRSNSLLLSLPFVDNQQNNTATQEVVGQILTTVTVVWKLTALTNAHWWALTHWDEEGPGRTRTWKVHDLMKTLENHESNLETFYV
ncbi:hypothetical protein DAPPUDRAFT_99428 [Daphnia pulex]|uniref:Uncharacterized protein n=1 Tax=Daphnia pulex TaxID=6669 RepID=E9G6V8_DAPPU|nr:hypothetical protein DAPPUDRAFT_99428 [Daphnia pulex]|eukprot:EFX84355.1 hypothetical protein DAPPUDRAFT_99428 [Daphnia pulex]